MNRKTGFFACAEGKIAASLSLLFSRTGRSEKGLARGAIKNPSLFLSWARKKMLDYGDAWLGEREHMSVFTPRAGCRAFVAMELWG
ncbi:MAG TPA: hypothetical protein VFG34_03260 [Sphingopyxis sp.]|nr:hypothetical protein [Sphingopyxis sp.]